jgi:hypothetical protein
MKRDDLCHLARLALQLVRQRLSMYAHKFTPKRYTQPSLLACFE